MAQQTTVLLMEDDADTASATAALIEALGYAATRVRNGRELLRALSENDFSAIMLDLIIPDLDGFAVLERLLLEKPHLLQRVIVTTWIPDKYIEGLDRSRICGVIEKPVDVEQLEHLLRHCTSRVRSNDEPGGEFPNASS